MRPKPSKLVMVRQRLIRGSEICHQLFDFPSAQFLGQQQSRPANQAVSTAERKCQPHPFLPAIGMQFANCIRVRRIGMDGIGALAWLERELPVPGSDAMNMSSHTN